MREEEQQAKEEEEEEDVRVLSSALHTACCTPAFANLETLNWR